MSYDLPKSTKTQRLNSLPDDLKKIAQELIAKKFDIPEVVQRKASTPFGIPTVEDYRRSNTNRYQDPYDGRASSSHDGVSRQGSIERDGYGYDIHESGEYRVVTFESTSEQAIIQAFRSLDNAGIRSQNRRIVVGQAGFHVLRKIPTMITYSRVKQRPDMLTPQIAEIYGIPVFYDKNIDRDHIGSNFGYMEGWN